MNKVKGRQNTKEKSRNEWKEGLRKACFDRIQTQRAQLLSKYRKDKSNLTEAVQNIIQSSIHSQLEEDSDHLDRSSTLKSAPKAPLEFHEVNRLSKLEYETLMTELEQHFMKDLEESQNSEHEVGHLDEHIAMEQAELDEISELFDSLGLSPEPSTLKKDKSDECTIADNHLRL